MIVFDPICLLLGVSLTLIVRFMWSNDWSDLMNACAAMSGAVIGASYRVNSTELFWIGLGFAALIVPGTYFQVKELIQKLSSKTEVNHEPQ